MPNITLDLEEVQDGLPPVCMRCGARTTLVKERTFTWTPQWVGLTAVVLPLCIILAISLRKRVKVAVPLCERHQNHWSWRVWAIGGSVAALAVFVPVTVGVMLALGVGEDSPVWPVFVIGVLILFLAWIITAAILETTKIRPLDMTEYSIALTGVSQQFVNAVYDEREDEDEDDDEDDEDEDDYPPPRRRPTRSERVHDPDAGRRRPPPDSYRRKDR
jgi:hypothetical protein